MLSGICRRAVRVPVTQAVIVENEITYRTLPVPSEDVVLWGKGFAVSRLGALPWLRDADHRDRWGREPAPTAARFDRLTAGGAALCSDLVSDTLSEAVRLEEERIDQAWVEPRIPYQ